MMFVAEVNSRAYAWRSSQLPSSTTYGRGSGPFPPRDALQLTSCKDRVKDWLRWWVIFQFEQCDVFFYIPHLALESETHKQ